MQKQRISRKTTLNQQQNKKCKTEWKNRIESKKKIILVENQTKR